MEDIVRTADCAAALPAHGATTLATTTPGANDLQAADIASVAVESPDGVEAWNYIEHGLPAIPVAPGPVREELQRPIAKQALIETQGMPNELLTPPGILADVLRWILASARQPQAEMSLQATLAFGSAVMGQLYEGPTGVRSNAQFVGIARSGFGKNHPQICLKTLLRLCGLESVLGGTSIASGSALLAHLRNTRGHAVYVIDEFDSLMSTALGKKAPAYQLEIATYIQQLYSASDDALFKGKDFADTKVNKNSIIAYPSLTMVGYTTVDKFYGNLKSRDVASGFLNRMVVLQAPDKRPAENDSPADKRTLPAGVEEWVRALRMTDCTVEGATGFGATPDCPVRVPYADDKAGEILDGYTIEVKERMDKLFQQNTGLDDALVRCAENAHKIALICAGAKFPDRPRIDVECAEWAVKYVRHCSNLLLRGVETQMVESEFDESVQKIHAFVVKQGERGAGKKELSQSCRAYRKLNEWSAAGVFARLQAAGTVELRLTKRGAQRWFAVEPVSDLELDEAA